MDSPPIPIIYRDNDLVVVNKPSGLVVHRGWGDDQHSLVAILRAQLDQPRLHVLHRLDRGTSGVLVLGMNPEAAAAVNSQFRQRQVEKTYLALVRGSCQFSGLLDHPIPKAPGDPRVPAQTRFQATDHRATQPRETSLVIACPLTGRTHQIRRHLKHLNHPIIGDANYGKGAINRAFRQRYGLARLALHATTIHIEHPTTGQPLRLDAPLPDDLRDPLIRMGYTTVVN